MGTADTKPLISVIVPVYKVEEYLPACIDSILAQTYQNLEIILVDDGSPDNCPAICDEYAKKDSRICVIHKENGGLSDARNAGLNRCRGEYISFIDSDDTISKNWIENLQCVIKDFDFVIAGVTYVNNEKIFSQIPEHNNFLYLLSSSLFGYCWNKLYKRKAIGNQRFIEVQREDIIFNLQLIANNCRYTTVDESGYLYLQRNNSLLHSISVTDNITVFQFEEYLSTVLANINKSTRSEIYNTVILSYITDHMYKLVKSDLYSFKEKVQRIKELILYRSFKEKISIKFADNIIYKIFYFGMKVQCAVMIMWGYKICQILR